MTLKESLFGAGPINREIIQNAIQRRLELIKRYENNLEILKDEVETLKSFLIKVEFTEELT